ncbi:MAG: 2-oxo acid dehydrogenase subunit E2 [Proteobacteria bacterium]|nr:2-oxo acid dehydrogenase subunit E2 [Pseudomonadota bacterium]
MPPVRATPVARRLAEDLGVELDRVPGSGAGGRVTKADVEATAQSVRAPSSAPRSSAPAPGTLGEFLRDLRVPTHRIREGDQVVPFSGVRRRIAEHMVVSKIVSPHVGAVARVDLQRVVAIRERVKADFRDTHGFGLTYLPFVVQAVVRALREFPRMNATVVGQSIVEHSEIHVGVAVETERGLLVPVVRHADRLSLSGIAEAIQDLAERARTRQIGADELAGGTFTLSNPGRRGNLYGFAVINQPQVGILRTGEVRKTPVVVEREGEDAIAIRPVMHLALSYDHRIIDGVTGNGFLFAVGKQLESGDFEL